MSCNLILDPGPFNSGSQVYGTLECTFRDKEKIRCIKIRVTGTEHTEWIRSEDTYDATTKRSQLIHYPCTGNVTIFDFEVILFGGNNQTHKIGPGIFNYPFSFTLPKNLPSTFLNKYGNITYTLRGIVDIPWALDYVDKILLDVESQFDLNTLPIEYFRPSATSDSKTICCWCWSSGDINVDVNINKRAFTPGESIRIFMYISNMSNSNIEGVGLRLVQRIKSKVQDPPNTYKEDEFEFGLRTWPGVGAHGERNYDMDLLIRPSLPYPNLNPSTLFEVYYEVEIRATVHGCHKNIDLNFTVEIGRIQNQIVIEDNLRPRAIASSNPNIQPSLTTTAVVSSGPTPSASTGSRPTSLVKPGSPPDYVSVYPGGRRETDPEESEEITPSAPPPTEELPPSCEDASGHEKK